MDSDIAKDAGRRTASRSGAVQALGTENSSQQTSVAVAICGEPVVGRALALLLRSPGYDTKFVPAAWSGEAVSLEGAHLLLLAPTPGLGAKRRNALIVALEEATALAGIPMLELVAAPERMKTRHAQVPWPCSAARLERCIETALLARHFEENREEPSQAAP